MVSLGALQTGLVCTHAFPPLSARQRVREGVRLRLPQGRTVAALAQDPLVFSQLKSSPVLGIFCLKRACFPVNHSRCLQLQHFRFICTLESKVARTNYKHSLTSSHAARLWLIVHSELFLQKGFSLTRSSLPQPEGGKLLDEQRWHGKACRGWLRPCHLA